MNIGLAVSFPYPSSSMYEIACVTMAFSGDIPLHRKVAAKIKAESLARSAVTGSGTIQ